MANKKPIKGYEGIYEIDENGNVYNVKRNRQLKPRLSNCGYHQVWLYRRGKAKAEYVHRLVAQSFLDNPNGLPQVDHINGCKTDNSISNLEWVTASENVQRAFDKGLKKPTDRQKLAVSDSNRKRCKPVIASNGEVALFFKSSKRCAEALKISDSYVAQILSGRRFSKRWKIIRAGGY